MKSNNLVLSPDKISAFGMVDGLSLQNLFYANNGYFPNIFLFDIKPECYLESDNFFKDLRKTLNDQGVDIQYAHYQYHTTLQDSLEINPKAEKDRYSFVIPQWNVYARVEPNTSECYILFDHDNEEKAKIVRKIILEHIVFPEKEKNNVYLIASRNSNYQLKPWSINQIVDFNISEQYNDDFIAADKTITEFMSNDESGLIILHGKRGTGKTTYIRHLISLYPDKKFVFIHPSLIRLLGQPDFGNFLSSLKEHVIILEDCENAIRKRKTLSSDDSAVALLLNMTDGLLSDELKMKFICTFNDSGANIDEALTRKGRLFCDYEFENLCQEKATALLRKVTSNDEIIADENGMSLSDIYYYSLDSYEKQNSKISF